MAEPFVFHFKPDERGRPQVMTIADARGICSLCKHDEIQRFYRAIPFHPMTLQRLLETARGVRDWAGYACANCGTDVGPEDVDATTFVWGFADDSGLIRIFRHGEEERFQLVPGRRLDPQELPGFEPEPDAILVDELTERTVEEHLRRPFSIKLAVRELLVDVWRDPEGAAWAPLGPGLWIAVDVDADDLPATIEAIDTADFVETKAADALEVVDLADAIPGDLPTLDRPADVLGRVETWLGPDLHGKLVTGEITALFLVDRRVIADAIARAFEVARLEFERTDRAITDLETPTEREYPHDIAFRSVARRAAYTGISPGESARLTAEEIVGTLLDVHRRRI